MLKYIFLSFLLIGNAYGQTKWSKCKIDKTKLNECLDGEVKKKEYNKWYIAYECENEEEKHYFWVADKIISENADTPLQIGLSFFGSLLGTSVANNSSSFEDASDEIIPLIEERKKIISSSKEVLPDPAEACASLLGCGILGILFATTVLYY
jgi:hypothetical protein